MRESGLEKRLVADIRAIVLDRIRDMSDEEAAELLGVFPTTIEGLRERCCWPTGCALRAAEVFGVRVHVGSE